MTKAIIGERIKQIRKKLKLSQENLSSVMGIGNSALSMIETGRAQLSERNKNILIQEYNINPDWLESGNGEMFNANNNGKELFVNRGRTDVLMPMQSIPLYNITAAAGLTQLFDTNNSELQVENYLHLPNLPKCNGAAYVRGDSMLPTINPGDIIIYQHISDKSNIVPGEIYMFCIKSGEDDYVLVKQLSQFNRNSGVVTLKSFNPAVGDAEFKFDDIRAVAWVKGWLHLSSN